ncbi:MAG TPA: MarR family transcriptional regulator [Acidimicrobiales bacterium]
MDTDPTPLDVATRAAGRLSKVVENALDEVGLSLPQYRLMVLLSDGSAVATALARRLTVSRPSITALADGLVDRGYVERLPDPLDRRRVTHTLTPGGHDALRTADVAIRGRLETVVAHLPSRQRRTAIEGLALWVQALDLHRAAQEAAPA